jgi:hypothetical protein
MTDKFYKAYVRFHIGMGIYGFTRGLRITDYKYKQRPPLLTERIGSSLINSVFYAIPIYSFYHFFRFINRLEIHSRDLKKEDYKSSFEEPVNGICNDIL